MRASPSTTSGRTVHVGHFIYKVLTQKGAEGWDSLSVGWEPWHDARPIIRARVIAPDFTVHTLDPNTITEAPARGGDYKIYSDGKRLRAPFPGHRSRRGGGRRVHRDRNRAALRSRPRRPRCLRAGRRSGGAQPRDIRRSRGFAAAHQPAAAARLKPVRTEANGRVTLTFDIGPLEGIDPREPYLPHDTVCYPMIEFSTGASWQSMAAEYAKIVDSRANSAAVKAVVEPLIAGKKTAAEKEAAILDYLDREVRYTGIEFGEAAIVPHDPAETLAKKYGDCKDKATLLVAMLRAAGIPAYVALLNAGSRMDVPADLPGMGMFDHAIVYVPGRIRRCGSTPPTATRIWDSCRWATRAGWR